MAEWVVLKCKDHCVAVDRLNERKRYNVLSLILVLVLSLLN